MLFVICIAKNDVFMKTLLLAKKKSFQFLETKRDIDKIL